MGKREINNEDSGFQVKYIKYMGWLPSKRYNSSLSVLYYNWFDLCTFLCIFFNSEWGLCQGDYVNKPSGNPTLSLYCTHSYIVADLLLQEQFCNWQLRVSPLVFWFESEPTVTLLIWTLIREQSAKLSIKVSLTFKFPKKVLFVLAEKGLFGQRYIRLKKWEYSEMAGRKRCARIHCSIFAFRGLS